MVVRKRLPEIRPQYNKSGTDMTLVGCIFTAYETLEVRGEEASAVTQRILREEGL